MALSIGRLGSIAVATESTYGVFANPTDNIPYLTDTFQGDVTNDEITAAYGVREKVLDSVQTKQWAHGDVELYLDPKFSGYFFASALGTSQTVSLGNGNFKHIMTRANVNNVATSLSVVIDRVTDRVQSTGVGVDMLSVDVKDGLATLKAGLIGKFPTDSAASIPTTTSGTVFTYTNAVFAFGTTVSGAASAQNLKLSEFKLDIKNNAEAVFRHGSAVPDTINYRELDVTADFTLFFENKTDRNTFWNSQKQAANVTFTGRGLAGGQTESLSINLYRTHIDKFSLETGLANFFAEKATLMAEYDTSIGRSIDATFINNTNAY